MTRKRSPRQLIDAATSALTRRQIPVAGFVAYTGGNMMPMPKPFLVHVRGAQLPFDPALAEYWHLQHKMRRAK